MNNMHDDGKEETRVKISIWSMCLILLLALTACDEKEDVHTPADPPDHHTARIALDYYGSYEGVLPCADCEGIKTRISLMKDGDSYIKRTRYLGKSDEWLEQKGYFYWKEDGSRIRLEGIDPPNLYFVRENALQHLDMQGQRITGELEQMYILQKVD